MTRTLILAILLGTALTANDSKKVATLSFNDATYIAKKASEKESQIW